MVCCYASYPFYFHLPCILCSGCNILLWYSVLLVDQITMFYCYIMLKVFFFAAIITWHLVKRARDIPLHQEMIGTNANPSLLLLLSVNELWTLHLISIGVSFSPFLCTLWCVFHLGYGLGPVWNSGLSCLICVLVFTVSDLFSKLFERPVCELLSLSLRNIIPRAQGSVDSLIPKVTKTWWKLLIYLVGEIKTG